MNKGLKYKTIRGKLGFFGWASRIALIGWTVAMLAWLVHGSNVAKDADTAGAAIGAGLGIGIIIALWVGGTVIFGIWALLTRPPKALVPQDE